MADDKTIIADDITLNSWRSPKKVSACLVQYSGSSLGKRYMLNKDVMVVGRSPDGDLVINEQSVSRQHAKCYTNDDGTHIEDLGSSNGSFINDVKITGKTQLKDGDMVRFGTVILKFFSQNNLENLVQDNIYRMAFIDAGTDTFNKKHLTETLDQEFSYARSSAKELSIIYFDLDFFKKVNDTYGHTAGDYVLKHTAMVVKQVLRKDDVFCRFGGEEFVILLPNTNAKSAYDLAERIRKAIEAYPFQFENHTIKQTVSLGVSQLNGTFQGPSQLLADADRKLYSSKQNGRNLVTI